MARRAHHSLAFTSLFSLISCCPSPCCNQPYWADSFSRCHSWSSLLYFCTCSSVWCILSLCFYACCLQLVLHCSSNTVLPLDTLTGLSGTSSLFCTQRSLFIALVWSPSYLVCMYLCLTLDGDNSLRKKSVSYPSLWPHPLVEERKQAVRVPLKDRWEGVKKRGREKD